MLSFPNMYNTSYQKCNVFPLFPYFSSMAMEKTLMTPYMGHKNGKELKHNLSHPPKEFAILLIWKAVKSQQIHSIYYNLRI